MSTGEVEEEAHYLPMEGFCVYVLEFGVRNPVSNMVLIPGDCLAVGTWDGKLRVVNLMQRACTKATQVTEGRVCSVCCWQPSDEAEVQLFAGNEDGEVSCWISSPGAAADSALRGGHLQQRLSWRAHSSHVMSLRSTGGWLISASEDRTVRLWDAASGALLADFYGHTGGVQTTSVADQERLLWSGSRDHSVRSWDLGEVEKQLKEQTAMAHADEQSREFEIASRPVAKKKSGKNDKGRAGKK